MKYFFILASILLVFVQSGYGQSEEQWKNYYMSTDQKWRAKEYNNLLDVIHFKGVKVLKNYDVRALKTFFISLTDPEMKQLDIDGWYFCSTKHEDMYELWNLWYPHMEKTEFDAYCKGLIGLMVLDGTLKDH